MHDCYHHYIILPWFIPHTTNETKPFSQRHILCGMFTSSCPSPKPWGDRTLTSLPRGVGHSDRSASRPTRRSALLTLVKGFDNLANVVLSLELIGGCFDAVERVRGLDEDGVVDDDLRICPPSW